MDGKKVYQIEINGIKDSISAVDALNKALNDLEQRIKSLEAKNVKVGGYSGSKSSALSEEAKLEKQIAQIDEKRKAYSKEIYQNYLAAKDVLKETVNDQKQIAAQERLQANAYSNTMQGLKDRLKDIQALRNVTDMSTQEFKKLTTEANTLTEKLKELEAATGSYGRNVGNYSSAFNKIKVAVGGSVREFNNYRQAIKELKAERFELSRTLGQEAEQYKEIDAAVKQLESDYNDLNKSSKFMDNLLDTMQGFTALASVGQGMSALFGFDDDKIQKSIQKLVALQNVLKGIETISLQMQRNEGIGSLFAKGNSGIDNFVAKLTGAKVTMNGLAASSRAATVAVRGLSMALKGIGIGLLLAVIPKVIDGFSNIGKEMSSAEKQANRLDEALNALNQSYKDRNDLIASSYMKGGMSDEQFLTNMYQNQTDYLNEQIYLLRERASLMNKQSEGGFFSFDFMDSYTKGGGFTGQHMNGSNTIESYSFVSDLIPMLKVTVDNMEDVEREFNNCSEAIKENKDYFSKWGDGLSDWVNSLFTTVSDTERVMRGLGNTRLSDFIATFADANQKFKDGKMSAEEYGKQIGELKKQLNSSDVLKSVIANLDQYIPDEAVREAVNNIISEIIRLDDAFNMTSAAQVHHWAQVRIDGMKEGSAKINAQIDADEKYEIAQYGKTQEQIDLIHQKYTRKRLDEIQKYNEQAKQKAKQHAKEMDAVDKELNSLRIQNMQDGLEKQLAQLEEERRQKLKKAQDDGIKVGELQVEINKLYDKKIKEAKEEWSYQIQQVYINMWNRIYQINHKNAEDNFESQKKEIEKNYQELRDLEAKYANDANAEYSDKGYGVKTNKNGKMNVMVETDDSYTKRLKEEYTKRTEDRKKYYAEVEKLDIEEANKQLEIANAKAAEAMNNELRNLKNSYDAQDHEMLTHLKKGEITLAQYNEAVKRLEEERGVQEALIQTKYNQQSEQREKEHKDKIVAANVKANNSVLNNYKSIIEKLQNIDSSEAVRNGFGFMNITATKRRNQWLIGEYNKLSNDLGNEIKKLENKLKQDNITEEQRKQIQTLIREYKNLQAIIGQTLVGIQQNTQKTTAKFVDELNMYFQAFGQTLQGIMEAIWSGQDTQFEKEQEEIDKYNDMLDEALDRQEEIIAEHKNSIDSIEDELATARGGRREHLIDQLNAEMEAERAAAKEKQRIEREQEKQKKKQEELDKKRKKAEYKRNLAQIIVSGAMAAANGFATQPFIPTGLAMGALATTLVAAQLAVAMSNKPYAKGGQLDGGVAQGNRHRDGGIKVLGGRAEIEGGEFITNRQTTESNIGLLEFINSKHKKLSIDDFVDFYNSGKAKKNFMASNPKTKFADGGVVPTLNNDYQFDNRLISAFEEYNNRPVVVSVVDINNRQAAVRNVKVLAGLED